MSLLPSVSAGEGISSSSSAKSGFESLSVNIGDFNIPKFNKDSKGENQKYYLIAGTVVAVALIAGLAIKGKK